MASDLSFAEYVIEQASEAGDMTCKKMFGEYGLYCNGMIVGLICDNIVYVKKTKAGIAVCPKLEEGFPYKGAKPYFVFDGIEDGETLAKLIRVTYDELLTTSSKQSHK